MKNVGTKILAGVGAVALTAAVFSFASSDNPDQPEMKNYEVIRMVNGQTTVYDTTVAVNSNYSPNDYLADLGFANDNEISIIDFTLNGSTNEFTFSSEDEGDGEHKVVMIELDEETEDIQQIENADGNHEIRIEKKVIKTEDGEDVDIQVEVDQLLEGINIDSLIAVAMEGHEGDSGQVIVKKMIISEEEVDGDGTNLEWHSIDAEGADYHKEVSGDNHHMEVAVWGDAEDFTLVIVSDPSTDPSTKTMLNKENKEVPVFKVFPNPSNSTSEIQLNFADKAPTSILITDMRGATVAKMQLGEYKGQFNKTLDVSKWEKGVYIIQVDHGSEKLMEKLIVE